MKVFLAVDPGVNVSGFSVLSCENGRLFLLECDTVTLLRTMSLPERLSILYESFEQHIKNFSVTDLVLETPFLGRNAQNFLKLGYVRGLLYVLAHRHGLAIHEFAPRQIKRMLTGHGGAEKDQVARVVLRLFPGLTMPNTYDATDSLALGLCAVWSNKPVFK